MHKIRDSLTCIYDVFIANKKTPTFLFKKKKLQKKKKPQPKNPEQNSVNYQIIDSLFLHSIYDCIKKDKRVLSINLGIHIKISASHIKMCLPLSEIEKFNDNSTNRIFLTGVSKHNRIQ